MYTTSVEQYLSSLKAALREAPYGLANDLYEGIAEELGSLSDREARARIAELGAPEELAAEMMRESQAGLPVSKPAGATSSAWYVIVTPMVVAIGGIAVPVFGWVIGIVLMWVSPVWGRVQKWLTTLIPVIALAAVYLVVFVWQWVAPSPTVSGGFTPPSAEDYDVINPLIPINSVGFGLNSPTFIIAVMLAVFVSGVCLLVAGVRRQRART